MVNMKEDAKIDEDAISELVKNSQPMTRIKRIESG